MRRKINRPAIVIVGAGNLATHLALALSSKGYVIKQIAGRTEKSAKVLAKKLDVPFTLDLKTIDRSADIYIFSISDDNLHSLSKKLKLKGKTVLHTSGSVSVDVLKDISPSCGVVYPLYTFNANDKIDFREVPFFVEGTDAASLKQAKSIAKSLSGRVSVLSSHARERLHVAAVVASNFTNYLYTLASEFLAKEASADFILLLPLIRKTVDKLEKLKPFDAQTGPARRKDRKVIAQHERLLRKHPELLKVYELLSSGIQKRYAKKK